MDNLVKHLCLLPLFFILGCSSWSKEQGIVDRAIEAHGGKLYEQVKISFDFRDRHYEIFKSPSRFEYSREFTDSTGLVLDVLDNGGFVRQINGKEVKVTGERMQAYANSVNSVAYFAFLPYGLNDPAARKRWKGETELDGQTYDLIEVTFDEEGGGEDFEDEFLYWFNKESRRLDYLAYSYHTEGGGLRFRKAVNPRNIGGILIQDYENYRPKDPSVSLEDLEGLFRADELELLSEIRLKHVTVEVLDE